MPARNWNEASKPAFNIARNMFRMVQTLNAEQLQNTKGVSCWTCHGGQTRPSRLPKEALTAMVEKWPEALLKHMPRLLSLKRLIRGRTDLRSTINPQRYLPTPPKNE